MTTSVHYINSAPRRWYAALALIIMMSTPLAIRGQAGNQGPGPLDLSNLEDISDSNHYIHIGYEKDSWVYKVGKFNAEITNGIPFNGTITGEMTSENKKRQIRIHSSVKSQTLTLQGATISHGFNQIFQVSNGAELTLEIGDNNSIAHNEQHFIVNYGTLTLEVENELTVYGITNGSLNQGADTGTLTINATKRLTVGNIINGKDSKLTLGGEIDVFSSKDNTALESWGTLTIEEGAQIRLRAINTTAISSTTALPFIEFAFGSAPGADQTLTVTPVGESKPAATFTTDGTGTHYAFPAEPNTLYTATLDGERLYSDKLSYFIIEDNTNPSMEGGFAAYRTSGRLYRYRIADGEPDTSQPLDLHQYRTDGDEAINLLYDDGMDGWTCDGMMFNGEINSSSSYADPFSTPFSIKAQSDNATLTLNAIDLQSEATALTIAGGHVTLKYKGYPFVGSTGAYGIQVKSGATCSILPNDDDGGTSNSFRCTGKEGVIHPDNDPATLKGLTLFTWAKVPQRVVFYTEEMEYLGNSPLSFASVGVNLPVPFEVKVGNHNSPQEGYLSTGTESDYTSHFPATPSDGVTQYIGMRNGPGEYSVIINDPEAGGSLTVMEEDGQGGYRPSESPEIASGSTAHIFLTLQKGYKLSTITYKGSGEGAQDQDMNEEEMLSGDYTAHYSFTMPQDLVTITATTAALTATTLPDNGAYTANSTDSDLLLKSGEGQTSTSITIANTGVKNVTFDGVSSSATTFGDQNSTPMPMKIRLEGENDLGEITINEGASLTLLAGTDATLTGTISNSGSLTDLTGLVSTVTLPDNTTLERQDPAKETPFSPGGYAELTADISLSSGSSLTPTMAYQWQTFSPDDECWITAPDDSRLRATGPQRTYRANTPGSYRCLVTAVVDISGKTVSTTLLTTAATVKRYAPPAEPSTYTVTLPSLTGAKSDPTAGTYSVTESDNFTFTLTLEPDYDQSTPQVTVNESVLPPGPDGKYTIKDISADQVIRITGIVKNTPTTIEQIANQTRIHAEGNTLLIGTPVAVGVRVISLAGTLIRDTAIPAGESRIHGLASGIYIVRLSNEIREKVIIR